MCSHRKQGLCSVKARISLNCYRNLPSPRASEHSSNENQPRASKPGQSQRQIHTIHSYEASVLNSYRDSGRLVMGAGEWVGS